MIISFRHKGLREFYETGSTKGIQIKHAQKLRYILAILDVAEDVNDVAFPSFRLHSLQGDLKNYWSIRVNGNWRVTFKFIGKDIELVDYQDYH
ncbi:proteic killer suppression protein [Bartonella australis AUST/NH1]|uniref:Proteic killer suppression protein n=1 Tax=Bartonella australis (strain Aust/NH1) TaxID=1094489 RepID=M1P2U3_BARAA|nr:type II toxin-antitoxin system RelE/ParE family toxin [Bartonella australis]AGF74140.1 proteic killer suppression protein [Bartonella australis AUST/NH1]